MLKEREEKGEGLRASKYVFSSIEFTNYTIYFYRADKYLCKPKCNQQPERTKRKTTNKRD